MATLQQIADEAGVSKHTVARVLSGKNKEVWPSTIERANLIREIVKKHGYRTNAAAAAVRSKRFNATGLLLSSTMHKASISWHTQSALLKAHHELDKHLIVGQLNDSQLTTDGQMPKLLRQWAVDALLVFYTWGMPEKMVQMINDDQVPSVWMNADLDHNTVRPDDLSASWRATQRLIDSGHRRVSHLYFGRTGHYSVTHRRQGYEHAMQAAGLSPASHVQDISPTWEIGDRPEAIKAMLSSPDRPTAVITNGLNTTLTVMYVAAQLGLRVPEDLSVFAIADNPVNELGTRINTMSVAHEDFGRKAVEMVERRLADPGIRQPVCVVPFDESDGQTITSPSAA